MRVLWANDKLQDPRKDESKGVSVKKTRGSTYIIPPRQTQNRAIGKYDEPEESIDNSQATEGSSGPMEGQGDSCKVCGSQNTLHSLSDYNTLIFTCFGIKVKDVNKKICDNCTSILDHTNKFREMMRTALAHSGNGDLSGGEYDSSDSQHKSGAFVSRVNICKRDGRNRKSFVTCSVCKQKYPTLKEQTDDFICSRCKIRRSSDRSIACAQCRCVIPTRLMRDHLAMHAKADLTGRCRLRSLSDRTSSAQIDISLSKQKTVQPRQIGKQCDECGKTLQHKRALEEHKRIIHGEHRTYFCPQCRKDLKSPEFLEKHMKAHENSIMSQCNFCGKIFKTRLAIERHYEIHPNHNIEDKEDIMI